MFAETTCPPVPPRPADDRPTVSLDSRFLDHYYDVVGGFCSLVISARLLVSEDGVSKSAVRPSKSVTSSDQIAATFLKTEFLAVKIIT